jgi:riboflavin biosynthesis pyrimidine reductase
VQAVEKARKQFGDKILIEGGITMINELIDHGVIDQLELSVTPASGGDERIDWKELLARFSHCTSHEVEGTTFYSAHN